MDNEKAEKIISLLSELNENIVLMQKIQFSLLSCVMKRVRLFLQLKQSDFWDGTLENEFCAFKKSMEKKKEA